MLTANTGAEHWQPNKTPPFPPDVVITEFDWSARLSLDAIRSHTKTTDSPSVTDGQLRLYRDAAIDAASRYTGLLLDCQRTVTEPIQGPSSVRPGRNTYKFRLRHPVADGLVYFYGAQHPNENVAFRVPVNTRIIQVPIKTGMIDASDCCRTCGPHHLNAGMYVAYRAGYTSPDAVPPGVVLGCLQYICWIIEHPGDEILTVRNRRDARSEGAMGTNNVAIASGALETWRILDEDIV